LFICVKEDGFTELVIAADSRHYVFDKVVAIVKAFIFEQLCPWIVQIDVKLMIGAH
jgi:hypothetical protein